LKSLKAPNYTVFSNNSSAADFNRRTNGNPAAVSLESPHNAIHLAVGGFYQEGVYIASPIRGANGDMGCNETAAFDPIFFFHHTFIDYVFWKWQELHGVTAPGSIKIDGSYDGAKAPTGLPVPEGAPERPEGTPLTTDSALYPFLKADAKTYYVLNDLIDIRSQLGYDYGPGSLDIISRRQSYGLSAADVPIIHQITGIDSSDYIGSYVVRLYGYHGDQKVELGREAVLSRLKLDDCANCRGHLKKEFYIPLHKDVHSYLGGQAGGDYRLSVGIHTLKGEHFPEDDPHKPNPKVQPL